MHQILSNEVLFSSTFLTLVCNNYYDLHVIIRGVNKQNLGVYKSFISLRPKAEVK